MPALVLGGAWVITMLIYWIIHSAGGVDVKIGGGSQAPLWYFLVIGVQAMTLTFPFSQAMSLTRREFYVGSLAAAAVSGLGMSLIFVLLGLVEQATLALLDAGSNDNRPKISETEAAGAVMMAASSDRWRSSPCSTWRSAW